MIKRLGLLVAVVLVLALSQPVLAADSQGKILGNVVNGTAGGQEVGDQALTLTVIGSDNTTSVINGVSDGNGRFEFDSLSTDPSYQYQVSLAYQGVEYSSPQLVFGTEPVLNTQVNVYETTTDPAVVSVAASHMVIYPQTGSLLVAEYQVYNNNSDRTFVGSKPVTPDGNNETLRIPLPAGAVHFEIDAGLVEGSYIQDDTGVSDTMPLAPGTREIAFFYLLVSDTDSYALQHQFHYPTESFNLLVQGQDSKVSTADLVQQSPIDMSGTIFQYYTGQSLEAGKTVAFSLSPQPTTSGGNGTGSSNKMVIWVVLVLLVAAGGVAAFLVLRQRRSLAKATANSGATIQERLRALAQLDDDFEAGKITAADYTSLRSAAKRELAAILKRQKE